MLPEVIVDAGPADVERFLEFFAAAIANDRTCATYAPAAGLLSRLALGGEAESRLSGSRRFARTQDRFTELAIINRVIGCLTGYR